MTRPELVVVGGSWGGLEAVGTLLSALPEAFEPAVAVVLHRRHDGGETLARALAARGRRRVSDVHDKDSIERGGVYLAPADYHLLVEPGHFTLSIDQPVRFSRPSIDVLFESAAEHYGERLIAVLLTGAGADGAAGMAGVKRHGGMTLAQDPQTAVRPEMPSAAVAAGTADRVLPLTEIGPFLAGGCEG